MAYKELQVRRDTATNWTDNNPTLKSGELGFETDTSKFKAGDGSTAWTSLDYIDSAIDHDALTNFAADEHIAHSGITLTAGTGLTGGGNISTSRTLNCSITQYTDEMAQDAVGGILDNGTVGNIVFTYDDAGGVISAVTQDGEIDHDSLNNTHNLTTDIDHDALTNFASNEHFVQTAITNISTALATGLVKVTTTTGALSVITDSSTNWDTAYGWGNHAGLYDATGVAAGLVSGHESTYNHTNYNTAYSHSQIAGGDSVHVSTTENTNWDTAYSHSQLTFGNPHSVTPTELGLVIGTNVQAYDAALTSISGLTYASASFIKMSAEDTYVVRTIAETKSDLSLNLVENTALSTWAGSANITTLGTIATVGNITIADGGTIGNNALITFNDIDSQLIFTGSAFDIGADCSGLYNASVATLRHYGQSARFYYDAGYSSYEFYNNGITPNPNYFVLNRGRGDFDTPVIVEDDDKLGSFTARGWDGVDEYSDSSAIYFEIDGTPDENIMPGRIVFATSQAGTENLTTAATIDSSQNLTVVGNVTGANLNISNWDDAYTHSQLTSGNPHNVSGSDLGLGSIAIYDGNQDLETTDSPTFLGLNITANSDTFSITMDGSNCLLKTTDGAFIFQTDEGTDANTYVNIKGKGTGNGNIRVYDGTEYLYLFTDAKNAFIGTGGTDPGDLFLQRENTGRVLLFYATSEGDTTELKLYGNRTGDSKRSLAIAVGIDAADTASFGGVSNYRFGGNVLATGVYKVDDVQVVSNRVIDARCDDVINTGDATTDGVIDSIRDAMITHGLLAAS